MTALSLDVAAPVDIVATEVGASCYHCGEANPAGVDWRLDIDGAERAFCCAGCRAVAQTLRAAGLASFYARRTSVSCPPTVDDGWLRDAIAAEAAGQIAHVDSNLREISLLLEGIHCGACVWVIERYLQQRPGVVEVTSTLRCGARAFAGTPELRNCRNSSVPLPGSDIARIHTIRAARGAGALPATRAACAHVDRHTCDDAGDDVRGAGVHQRR